MMLLWGSSCLLASSEAQDAAMTRLMVGQWQSARHEYEYQRTGKWFMLPISPESTQGTWKIEDGQLFIIHVAGKAVYKILSLTKEEIVYSDGKTKITMTRIPAPNPREIVRGSELEVL